MIGNAFGWPTLLLSSAFPSARVVAIENLSEGKDARLGFDLTEIPIGDLGLDARALKVYVEENLAGFAPMPFVDPALLGPRTRKPRKRFGWLARTGRKRPTSA
ncbi:MAG TPA: hypothetical protein VIY27_01750 [Myxococcota bacterium]